MAGNAVVNDYGDPNAARLWRQLSRVGTQSSVSRTHHAARRFTYWR